MLLIKYRLRILYCLAIPIMYKIPINAENSKLNTSIRLAYFKGTKYLKMRSFDAYCNNFNNSVNSYL